MFGIFSLVQFHSIATNYCYKSSIAKHISTTQNETALKHRHIEIEPEESKLNASFETVCFSDSQISTDCFSESEEKKSKSRFRLFRNAH